MEAGQPLHPPVAYPVFDADCVVIRADLPREFEPSSAVMVRRYPGRVNVVEWLRPAALDIDNPAALVRLRSRLEDVARAHEAPAFLGAVKILHDPLSFEFPDSFPDLLSALSGQQVSGEDLLEQLAHVWVANELAAVRTDEPAPLHVLLGTPMRGVAGSAARRDTHLEVWQLDPAEAVIPGILTLDTARDPGLPAWLPAARRQARAWLRTAPLAWAFVEEARPQIVTRRDSGRPAQWLLGKTVLVLGCGAIGARIAEHCVRAGVRRLWSPTATSLDPACSSGSRTRTLTSGCRRPGNWPSASPRFWPSGVQVVAELGDVRSVMLGSDTSRPEADLIVDATANRGVSARIEWLRARSRVAGRPS